MLGMSVLTSMLPNTRLISWEWMGTIMIPVIHSARLFKFANNEPHSGCVCTRVYVCSVVKHIYIGNVFSHLLLKSLLTFCLDGILSGQICPQLLPCFMVLSTTWEWYATSVTVPFFQMQHHSIKILTRGNFYCFCLQIKCENQSPERYFFPRGKKTNKKTMRWAWKKMFIMVN